MSEACRSCGAPVVWIVYPTGKRAPLDAQPHADGTIKRFDPTMSATVLTGSELATARANGDPLHRSHFATCPNAAQHRKPREAGTGPGKR